MKKYLLLLLLSLFGSARAQTTRYFEFTTNCGHGNWQDTSFIAAASNPVLVDTVLANLSRPFNQRKFISGYINYGHGGHNHNGPHWFLWHFIPDQWDLVEMAIEVCDGCPYSDVDADTATWVGMMGQFCPWSGIPVREVTAPVGIDPPGSEIDFLIYPNPASEELFLLNTDGRETTWTLFSSTGQQVLSGVAGKGEMKLDISGLNAGIYFLQAGERKGVKVAVEGHQ